MQAIKHFRLINNYSVLLAKVYLELETSISLARSIMYLDCKFNLISFFDVLKGFLVYN